MTDAEIFNRLYQIGTPVTVARENAEPFGPFQTVTASEAKPAGFGTAFILVEGIVEPIDLNSVSVDFKRAAHLRGRTIEHVLAEEAAREAQAVAANQARKAALAAARIEADKADLDADTAVRAALDAEEAAKIAREVSFKAQAAAKAARERVEQLSKA